MRALFITTEPDPQVLVSAWDSWNDKSVHMTFDWMNQSNDQKIIDAAKSGRFDVIFYVGAAGGIGLPSFETFRQLRSTAKVIHLCWDSTDYPWHELLEEYKTNECFDLQVGIDGPINAPVDFATLTPIDPALFESSSVTKDIRCGFSGGFRDNSARGRLLKAVDGLTLRKRSSADYIGYTYFMRRCRMVMNICNTGTDKGNHIKMRVMESAFSKAALLELRSSPIEYWFPKESFFYYSNPKEASDIIKNASDTDIESRSQMLHRIATEKYTPRLIYGSILDRL